MLMLMLVLVLVVIKRSVSALISWLSKIKSSRVPSSHASVATELFSRDGDPRRNSRMLPTWHQTAGSIWRPHAPLFTSRLAESSCAPLDHRPDYGSGRARLRTGCEHARRDEAVV